MSELCIAPAQLYGRDNKLKREDVKMLQKWLQKQPHLPQLLESQVIIILHSCYYSIEAAKTAIDKYFTRKTLYPHIFHCPSEDTLRNTASLVMSKVLPKKTPEGNTVFLTRMLDYKVENYNFLNLIVVVNCVLTAHLHRHGFVDGLVAVLDFKGGSLGHVARVNLPVLKQSILHLQEGSAVRVKQMHIVNVPSFIDKVMALLKPLMNAKLFEMFQLHPSIETLYKYVPKECLPEDYGGELPSCKSMTGETIEELLENIDLLRWHDSQRVDETKRVGGTSSLKSGFGMEGSFKKLEID
ncbi:hypothetical protein Zmor_001341 [Zophobas morio]|uniref:CRAL-TRIO domain-containing protein n=1 Tax=Zophobas morio TaxID=2755281 RepID=A0AA38J522_9CUCU|nr:hypothetical protein Zmor_001341 [Zophobas morio]